MKGIFIISKTYQNYIQAFFVLMIHKTKPCFNVGGDQKFIFVSNEWFNSFFLLIIRIKLGNIHTHKNLCNLQNDEKLDSDIFLITKYYSWYENHKTINEKSYQV